MKARIAWLALAAIAAAAASTPVLGVDGTKLIDQARAFAGGLTPGDAPGFPVTISQPGSYRLSGNLTVPDANTTAIDITSSDVTIDLNGFAIIGPTVCGGFPIACTPTGTGIGIHTFDSNRITVRNGVVRGMGSIGLQLGEGGHGSTGHIVESLQVSSNGTYGMYLGGSICRQNVIRGNGDVGILIGGGYATQNYVTMNGSTGIRVTAIGVATENTVVYNGDVGISMLQGGLARGNTVAQHAIGMSLHASVGYLGNVLVANATDVSGGLNLDQNACDGAICP